MRPNGVLVAVFALATLLGCAPSDPPGDLYVQVPADDETLLEATQEAAAEWRACGSRQAYVTTLPGEGVPVRVVPPDDPDFPSGRRGVAMVVEGEPTGIKIASTVTSGIYRALLAHEIGHHLLLTPGHFGNGLMREGTVGSHEHVTEEDCQILRDRW